MLLSPSHKVLLDIGSRGTTPAAQQSFCRGTDIIRLLAILKCATALPLCYIVYRTAKSLLSLLSCDINYSIAHRANGLQFRAGDN